MKKHLNGLILTVPLLNFYGVVNASVVLPPVIVDHMVLQQKSDVSLWGKAEKLVSGQTC